MFEWLASPEAWIALGTLTALEIVLGIDNIIFISILVGRLPQNQRAFARKMGLGLAMFARLALLFSISWVMGLTEPWFTVLNQAISGRDLVLIGGGLGVRFGEPYVDRIRDAMGDHLFPGHQPPDVHLVGLGDLGGALGAALLVPR